MKTILKKTDKIEARPFGLSEENMESVLSIFQKYSDIMKVVIFGSRAIDKFTPTSDIDFAIWHSGENTLHLLASLNDDFDQSLIPYFVDIVDYETITSDLLKKQIDDQGVVIYTKGI